MSPSVIIHEKTLFDVLRDVWAAKFYMIFCAGLFLGLAIAFLSFANPYARAEMILAPANPLGDLLSSSLLSTEGTIAVQDQGGAHDLAFLRFENSYYGARVAGILFQNAELLEGLKQDKAFKTSKGFTPKNAAELSLYIKKRVKIEPVSGTPLRKLIYLHTDPVFATRFLSHIYTVSDELIRAQSLKDVLARISYLNETMQNTTDSEHRRVLTDILMTQERIRMLVSIDQPFSAAIIEPPSSLANTAWPLPKVFIPLFLFAGLLSGFILYGMRHYGR